MIDLSVFYEFVARLLPFQVMQAPYMQRALVGLLLLAPMCAAMGVQVVNFRMAFFSDAISHSAFAGVALGLLFGLDQRLTMLGFALLIGLGIVAVGRKSSLSADTIIGVFFAASIAFGLSIVSRAPRISGNIQRFLYGDILTINDTGILWTAGLFVALMAFQAVGFNRLIYIGLQPALAAAHRVRVRLYQYVFAALLSAVVIFSVWAVGVLLVTALLIVPAATARNLARSAGGMFWWAVGTSLFSVVAGLILSAQRSIATPTGATIILVASVLFAISIALSPVMRR